MDLITRTLTLDQVQLPDWAKETAKNRNTNEIIRKGISQSDFTFVENERAAIFIATSSKIDRDFEILVPSGISFKNFEAAGKPIQWAHRYDQISLGSAAWVKFDRNTNSVLMKVKFGKHQFANDVFEHLKEHPLSMSVGFIPTKVADDIDINSLDFKSLGIDPKEAKKARRIFLESELLEASIVPVPANPSCSMIAVSKGLISQDDLNKIGYSYEIIDPFKGDSDGEQEASKIEKAEEATKSGTDCCSQEEEIMGYCISDEEIQTLNKSLDKIIPVIEKSIFDELLNELLPETNVSPIDEILKSIEIEGKAKPKPEDEEDEEEDDDKVKFCDCESFDGEEDICKGCGGKRKPKKSYYEEIIKKYSNIIPDLKKKAIEEYKKGIQTKLYDVSSVPSSTPSRKMKIYCKFLECQIKDIYQNEFLIPLILNGAYLAGFKSRLSNYKEIDVRNFSDHDYEYPPTYEVLKINSKLEDDFLINGQSFYDFGGIPVILDFYPSYYGQVVCVSSSRKHMDTNKNFIKSVHEWVEKENPLKNEKFSLNKDFIEVDSNDSWNTILLDSKNTKVMKITEKTIKEKDNFSGRGILLVGPPGTGKTKVSRILMTQTDKTFIWVSSKDLQNDWYVTEKIALGFKLARQLAPTILLFEDIDNWISGKIVDLFKTELDGLKKNTGVVTILTTNNPEKLPDALLDRPGRFHDVLEFGYPSKDIRSQMIKNWLGEIDEKTLDTLIESTENYSGAHMWELIEFAKSIAEDEEIDIKDAIIQSLEKLNDQKELINTIRGKSIKVIGTKDLDFLLSGITEENIPKGFELEIEEKEFPIEIEEKEIEFTDEEIESVVLKVMQEKTNFDYDNIIKETILKLKGRIY